MKYEVLIKSYFPSLTKTEKIVADYILKNPEKIIYSTLRELAEATKVGEATIVRFCNKIGCNKFAELKLLIAKYNNEEEREESNSLLDKVSNKIKDIIDNSKSILDEQKVYQVADLINNARHLYIYGVGSSGISAREAETVFNRMGLYSISVTDSHFQTIYASNMSKKDVIIAFTISGITKDIYDSVKIAKDSNATLIVITNYIESPIAKLADTILLTAAKEHILDGGTTGGNISQLFVIDCIKNAYIKKYSKGNNIRKTKIAKNIMDKQFN